DPKAVPVMRALLADDSYVNRIRAAEALADLDREKDGVATVLVDIMLSADDEHMRARAASALLSFSSERQVVVPALRTALNDASEEVRRAAYGSLTEMDSPLVD